MPAYHLIYPMLEIEFSGNVAYLREYFDSEFTVVRKICKKKGNTKECFEQYFTVNYRAVPKGLVASKHLSSADRLQAITLYIAKHIKKRYVYTKKGFIDRKKPVWNIKINIINANAELKVYEGFRAEYYATDINQTKLRVSVVPVFEFEITPTLSEIIRKNIHTGVPHESILTELQNIDLSTIPEYWQKRIGPKYAGTLQEFYEPSHPEYTKRLHRIEHYYKYEKKKERMNNRDYWREVKNICQNIENDFIVGVKKYWQGKKTYNEYLGCLLLLTPNLETLSLFLKQQELTMLHDIIRPRPKKIRDQLGYRKDYQGFYNKIKKATEEYTKLLQYIPLVKVRRNAIVE